MKYASRHVLYPVPNVLDWGVVVVIVARMVRGVLVVVTERAVVVRTAFRSVVARTIIADCWRRVFAAVRAALDLVVVSRCITFVAVRAVAPLVLDRVDIFFCGWRVGEFVLRTAALATPTLTKNARINCNTVLIHSTRDTMISKIVCSDKKNEEKNA